MDESVVPSHWNDIKFHAAEENNQIMWAKLSFLYNGSIHLLLMPFSRCSLRVSIRLRPFVWASVWIGEIKIYLTICSGASSGVDSKGCWEYCGWNNLLTRVIVPFHQFFFSFSFNLCWILYGSVPEAFKLFPSRWMPFGIERNPLSIELSVFFIFVCMRFTLICRSFVLTITSNLV